MSLKQKIGLLRTWLNSRKVVYCEPLKDIDFAKDIDDGLKLLDDVDGALSEAAKQIQEIDLWKWLTMNYPHYNWDNLKDFHKMLEDFRRKEVLAILEGKEKANP